MTAAEYGQYLADVWEARWRLVDAIDAALEFAAEIAAP
jgi:hypothetical protein